MTEEKKPDDAERRRAGLCADCRYSRRIVSERGPAYYLCERAAGDASFAKYPRLPVVGCRGYERAG